MNKKFYLSKYGQELKIDSNQNDFFYVYELCTGHCLQFSNERYSKYFVIVLGNKLSRPYYETWNFGFGTKTNYFDL